MRLNHEQEPTNVGFEPLADQLGEAASRAVHEAVGEALAPVAPVVAKLYTRGIIGERFISASLWGLEKLGAIKPVPESQSGESPSSLE